VLIFTPAHANSAITALTHNQLWSSTVANGISYNPLLTCKAIETLEGKFGHKCQLILGVSNRFLYVTIFPKPFVLLKKLTAILSSMKWQICWAVSYVLCTIVHGNYSHYKFNCEFKHLKTESPCWKPVFFYSFPFIQMLKPLIPHSSMNSLTWTLSYPISQSMWKLHLTGLLGPLWAG